MSSPTLSPAKRIKLEIHAASQQGTASGPSSLMDAPVGATRTSKSLLQLPEVVLKVIVSNLNFVDLLRLRATNKAPRFQPHQ
ncbi:MAG: hypothetical protein SGARI_004768 [Bacillariaceae sp.]